MSESSEADVDPMREHKRMRMLMFTGAGAYLFAGMTTTFLLPEFFDLSEKVTFVMYGVALLGLYGFLLSVKYGLEARREYLNHE